MVGLTVFAPLGIGVLLEMAVFVVSRLRGRRAAVIPGALWLYAGSLLSAILLAALESQAI